MKFNKTIPELSVFSLEQSKRFYLDTLKFKVEYERPDEHFVFLSKDGNQVMLEEIHDNGWNTAELTYPLGRGINLSFEIPTIDDFYHAIISSGVPLFRELMISRYEGVDGLIVQKEFLIQDPNGYLLRFTD
ncbi:VOC family protein [Fructobacillus evanidus]|uniref:Bleomycin resistance protein n=1 Tax=Fructobacillus evanidus TaxID=3064281 RepID=A0ABN9YP02_9LACO|nr:3-dioxygenase or related enzyme [Fructobacillus sp. LMG 32999]CAK1234886.1 3-dioxygenase or related enzyme [Fructobacillus sp. LMG 32999]CAK1235706.1 3-dioxygenase or related enzyme [Fructobacillus sp. LMG 32999]CAK1236130.1 3-dioxygenase or related enzyme [Fructobacillus sp. LMG 32999]CAK1237589.1 3-dioxygenase or related enzyme [Fructobacillus sp. LMG 32999]